MSWQPGPPQSPGQPEGQPQGSQDGAPQFQAPPPGGQGNWDQPKKSNTKWWVLGCGGAFFFFVVIPGIVLLIGAIVFGKEVADKVGDATSAYADAVVVGDQFASAVNDNDAATAYGLTDGAYQRANPEAEVAAEIATISESMNGAFRVANQSFAYEDGATLVRLVYANEPAESSYLSMSLIKRQDKWFVNSFEWSATEPSLSESDVTSSTVPRLQTL